MRLLALRIAFFGVLAASNVLAAEPDCPPAAVPPTQAQIETAVRTARVLDARWDGFEAGYATEIVLVGAARAMGKPLRSLESVAVQRKALTGGTHEAQIKFVDSSLAALEQGHVRSIVKALSKAWADGDLAMLSSYEQ